MNKDTYCKAGPLPKGKTYGSMRECAAKKQIGYWGLNKIDSAVLKSVIVPKGISLDKARMLKIKFDARLKKLNTDLKSSEDKYKRNPEKHIKEKEKIKVFKEEIKKTEKELDKATKDYQQAFRLKEEQKSLKRGKNSKYKIDKPKEEPKEEPKEKSDLPDRINKTLEDIPKNILYQIYSLFYRCVKSTGNQIKYSQIMKKEQEDILKEYQRKYNIKDINELKNEIKSRFSDNDNLKSWGIYGVEKEDKCLDKFKEFKRYINNLDEKENKPMEQPKPMLKAMKEPKVKEEKKISKLDITQEEIEELMKMGITIKEIEKLLNNKSKKGRNA
jgi:predicted XRE-type DNA-binding protein